MTELIPPAMNPASVVVATHRPVSAGQIVGACTFRQDTLTCTSISPSTHGAALIRTRTVPSTRWRCMTRPAGDLDPVRRL